MSECLTYEFLRSSCILAGIRNLHSSNTLKIFQIHESDAHTEFIKLYQIQYYTWWRVEKHNLWLFYQTNNFHWFIMTRSTLPCICPFSLLRLWWASVTCWFLFVVHLFPCHCPVHKQKVTQNNKSKHVHQNQFKTPLECQKQFGYHSIFYDKGPPTKWFLNNQKHRI